jgi:Tfp pilus assembly protein PilF
MNANCPILVALDEDNIKTCKLQGFWDYPRTAIGQLSNQEREGARLKIGYSYLNENNNAKAKENLNKGYKSQTI